MSNSFTWAMIVKIRPDFYRATERLAVAATIVQSLLVASCQSGEGTIVAEPPSPYRMEFVAQFKKIDVAGKGSITQDQAKAHYDAVFTELDRNRDGFLDAKEVQPLLPVMAAKSAEELVMRLDRNGDDKLTRQEFLVITTWLFQLADGATTMTLKEAETGVPSSMRERKQPTLFGN